MLLLVEETGGTGCAGSARAGIVTDREIVMVGAEAGMAEDGTRKEISSA